MLKGIPAAKELLAIWKRLTKEERRLIQREISEVVAHYRRSQFRLVAGGRRKSRAAGRDG